MRAWATGWAFAGVMAFAGVARAEEFTLKIIAINDFHGNLESPGKARANAESPEVPVGGIEYMAGYVAQLKRENPVNIVVSAGDLTGGGPLISALFHDEDTIETMNRMGLEINAVGNHEFDKGLAELRRKQHGGCFPSGEGTCKGATVGTPVPFEGAKFEYLAANVIDTATGKTVFPAYAVKTYRGVKIGFIGLTLKDAPANVMLSMIAGLRFEDEVTTINGVVRRLQAEGVKSFVVLIHQGGFQRGGPQAADRSAVDINACAGGLDGSAIAGIVHGLDDAVELVVTAHTHAAYVCQIANRAGRKIPVTSAWAYSRALTDIDMRLDTTTKKVTAVMAGNVLIDRTNAAVVPDAGIAKILAGYEALAAPIVNRVVGTVTTDIKRAGNASGESALGDLVADAQLDATRKSGAVVALMNAEGIRTDLPYHAENGDRKDGTVTYGELYTAQPFANELVTMTLTGAQIKTVLEEQFQGCGLGGPAGEPPPSTNRRLEVSEGFRYAWSRSGEPCNKVDASSIEIDGVRVKPEAKYRVTMNNLMADGGIQLYVLTQGTDRVAGPVDIDAMTAYLAKHPGVRPIAAGRIGVLP